MSIPEVPTISGNTFKVEDLARFSTIRVPLNSPIFEAIHAIQQAASFPFMKNPLFQTIVDNKYAILKTEPAVEHLEASWRVTLRGATVLQRHPHQMSVAMNTNYRLDPIDDDSRRPRPAVQHAELLPLDSSLCRWVVQGDDLYPECCAMQ
jgi:hypothetical protein